MTSSMNSCGVYGASERPGTGCRVVVAVFGANHVCLPSPSAVRTVPDPGRSHDGSGRASLVGRIHGLLEARGLEILRMEQSSEPDCFALLVHAQTSACTAANLVALRRDLEQTGRELGLTIRVQREELFVYMHRV